MYDIILLGIKDLIFSSVLKECNDFLFNASSSAYILMIV